jgi:hypothetical protein
MRNVLVLAIALLLGGCVSMSKVESGEQKIGARMTVTIEGAWNRINAPGLGPADIWTMEGMPVDQLLIYSGIKDGQIIHATGSGAAAAGAPKNIIFRSKMQPDEIAAMFEGALTRDGSRFKLEKLEPAAFAGLKGMRLEFSLTRKIDNVLLSGMAYAAVSNGELFSILYVAPRLTFFSRHIARVEGIAKSARVKE